MAKRLLNLRLLAGEPVDSYRLTRFEGREAISEPFDYALEIVTARKPKLGNWIGKEVEFDVAPAHDAARLFAGQIHEANVAGEGEDHQRITLRVRPVFWGTFFTRGICGFQDRSSLQILDHLTGTLPGFVVDKTLANNPPQRAYAFQYDETEYEFLTRLFAQDGIMYLFAHSPTSTFRHKMILASSSAIYRDVVTEGGPLNYKLANMRNSISSIEHSYHSFAHLHGYSGAVINSLDQKPHKSEEMRPLWGKTFDSRYQEVVGGVADMSELGVRAKAAAERREQEGELVTGTSSVPQLFAGGRIPNAPDKTPARLVLTSVTHSCSDPDKGDDGGYYRNSFTAIDAARTFRAPIPTARRRAPGPLYGVVGDGKSSAGEPIVDKMSRVPVLIVHAHPKPAPIWLPVQQQWSQASYGAQFIPRIGTEVIIDFLYGDPDLPFIAGCFYTPKQKYPFDLPAQATRSGWRSKTAKTGSVVQELMFEDKAGGEEIHMYTGRNYRRQIDKDELATIDENNIKLVKKDQKLTVNGQRDVQIDKTQTVTVNKKALFESKTEIEIKVGTSTIVLKPTSIEIKAVKITVKADATIDVKAGAKYAQQAPMTKINGDATVIIQGGIVKIN